jgi:alkylation response protein AidB-like acyl-CoA dehydrogenase
VFTAVIVSVVETALEAARQQLERKRTSLRPYEQVEWSRLTLEGWLIQQAYDGMLRAVEEDRNRGYSTLIGKTAVAELAESVLLRICKVFGGGAYSRHSPFGFWLEDVRALGFLRPPWGLAYDNLFAGSWEQSR